MQDFAGIFYGEARKFTTYRPRKEQRKVEQVDLRKGREQRKESSTVTVVISVYMGGQSGENEKKDIHLGVGGQRFKQGGRSHRSTSQKEDISS